MSIRGYYTPIQWRLNSATYSRFRDLWVQVNNTPEDSPEYWELVDLIKSLPGFPHRNDPLKDMIHLVITDREH